MTETLVHMVCCRFDSCERKDFGQRSQPEPRIMRYELSDYEWTAIKPMLPNKQRGVPRVNDRRVINGSSLRDRHHWRLDRPSSGHPGESTSNGFSSARKNIISHRGKPQQFPGHCQKALPFQIRRYQRRKSAWLKRPEA
jgi:hypothetical protein